MLHRIKYSTAGESHGKGLLGIIEGLPAGLAIDEDFIAVELARRQQGHGRGKRMQIERDRAEIYAGVRHGFTLGGPIGLILPNKDWPKWTKIMSPEPPVEPVKLVTLPRPGHADLAGVEKFGFKDIRNVLERSSARETAMRVALAAICRKLLAVVGITIGSRVIQIAGVTDASPIDQTITPDELNRLADASPVRVLNEACAEKMITAIDNAKEQGDSLGGVFEIVSTGLPYGLGSHATADKKLPARIAAAMLSINAMKGVEIGAGFTSAADPGSAMHDEIIWDGETYQRPTNNAGGLEGGMTNTQPVVVRVAMKPIPTLIKPLRSVDIVTKEQKPAHKERTDSCAVPAASIIGEAMLAFVLADALLEKFGGDSIEQLKAHMAVSARY